MVIAGGAFIIFLRARQRASGKEGVAVMARVEVLLSDVYALFRDVIAVAGSAVALKFMLLSMRCGEGSWSGSARPSPAADAPTSPAHGRGECLASTAAPAGTSRTLTFAADAPTSPACGRGEWLPSTETPAVASQALAFAAADDALCRCRALMLADHAPMRLAFQARLARWGLHCDVAASVAEAEALRHAQRYDFYFTDCRLSGAIDGVALAQRWRATEHQAQLVCVMFEQADPVFADLPAGIAWLRKPLRPARLCALISSCRALREPM